MTIICATVRPVAHSLIRLLYAPPQAKLQFNELQRDSFATEHRFLRGAPQHKSEAQLTPRRRYMRECQAASWPVAR